MNFSTQQISPERWGIYSGDRLLATVGCKATCETFMANLVSGRRDAPKNDVDALYQAPTLRKEIAAQKSGKTDDFTVDSRLEAELSAQSLTVNELESAVLKAQENLAENLTESLPTAGQYRATQDARKSRKRSPRKDKLRSAS